MSTTVDIKVPKAFFADHLRRDLIKHSPNCITRELAKHYIVQLDIRDAADLFDDAHHYTVDASSFGWDFQYLVASARGTLQQIRKQYTYEQVCGWFAAAGYKTSNLRVW